MCPLITLSGGSLFSFLFHLFYKMRIHFPVFTVNPFRIPVKIQLIHTKNHTEILRHPRFHVTVTVLHADFLHDFAASGITDIMSRGNKWIKSSLPNSFRHGPSGFGRNPLMPEPGMQSISKIMTVAIAQPHIADGNIALLPADDITIGGLLFIKIKVSFFQVFLNLFPLFQREPGKKNIGSFIAQNRTHCI